MKFIICILFITNIIGDNITPKKEENFKDLEFSFNHMGFFPKKHNAIEVLQHYIYFITLLNLMKLSINIIPIEYNNPLNINEKFIISTIVISSLIHLLFFLNIELYRNIFVITSLIEIFVIILAINSKMINVSNSSIVIISNIVITSISLMILFIQTKKKFLEIPIDKLVKDIDEMQKKRPTTISLTL
ncbi:hypothetical protein AB836_02230 [Rickettsiales bacterium (ex Bugula neritina AB1)]|nr:hypothetical protein AB836_02230 [Rickettsiales bacterium (ex Bugula neritina AB1)]